MILIFSILVIAYYYFAKDSLKDYKKLTPVSKVEVVIVLPST